MLACTVLPFLTLIVEAHIRQLGDDDLPKRIAAGEFLDGALHTDGFTHYAEFLCVKYARESNNPKIKEAAERLYEKHKEKHIRNYPFFLFFFDVEDQPQTEQEAWKYMQGMIGDILLRAEYWAITTTRGYRVCFRTRALSAEQIHALVNILNQRRTASGANDVSMLRLDDTFARDMRSALTKRAKLMRTIRH